MAETFLGPVIEKLVELLGDEVKLLKGVHREVSSLKDELEIIQPFLKDAEAKLQKGELNEATKVWLKQIRGVADRIEDVVDEYLHHPAKRRRCEHGFTSSLQKAGDFFRALKPRYNIASEIQDIKELLLEIKARGQSYGLMHLKSKQGSSSTATNADALVIDARLGSLLIEEDELVGIDSTSNELITSLVEGSSSRSVISIVGEGGIGKTTLAKKVYDAEPVKQHFECFAWITVSQSYSMEKVVNIMKHQIGRSKEDTTTKFAFYST